MTSGPPPGVTPPGAGEPRTIGRPVRPARAVRVLDGLAGLLAAGILVVGVGLIIAALVAPPAVAAAGLGVADGPGWSTVLAHLLVGVAGEAVVSLRRRWSTVIRVSADLAVVLAALLVIWWAWLP